jgi:hypothetical protein
MSQLTIYNKSITSIFQLLGEKEDDITYSISYVLANSRSFLTKFLDLFEIIPTDFDNVKIVLQEISVDSDKRNRTDIEIIEYGVFHIILEAKRGFQQLPTDQIKRYAQKASFVESNDIQKRLAFLTDASEVYAKAMFDNSPIEGLPIEVIPYRKINSMLSDSLSEGNNAEKHLINQLKTYLEKIITMQKIDTNWVWVVSLGDGGIPNIPLSFKEIVKQKNIYFHPIGNSFPSEPVTYIAFRYEGKLQAIHHVDSFEAFKDFSEIDSDFSEGGETPHFLYRLGKPILPNHEVKNGSQLVMANRVWCMLDTLLTCNTIWEAKELSEQRETQSK